MNQEKIGRFISQCRKEQGLTQEQLAEKLHITNKAISKWETGKGMPDSSIMLELCRILKISVNELLSGQKNQEEGSANEVIIDSIEISEKQRKKMSQGVVLLGCAISSVIVTIIYGSENTNVVVWGGISFSFILAGMITLFNKS
jgi:transcriptional regulator with XRE-family HTH domain